jgi:glycosyltransferase involved in cell wall biosynthesis
MKIAILGPYPPPYGGTSVHVQRLKERLEQKGIACVVYDYSGVPKKAAGVVTIRNRPIWVLTQLFHSSANVIYCRGYSPMSLVGLSLLAAIKRKRVIITTGGFLFGDKPIGLRHKLAFLIAAKTGVHFVAESLRSKEIILSLGVKPENVNEQVIPGFIPPIVKAEEVAQIPQKAWDFIDSHSPILTANAFRISFYNGQDLYGIDLCVDLCANLKASYPGLGFVFCLPDIGDHKYFGKMRAKIRDLKIEANFLFVTKPCPYYPIQMKSHLFVRPTNTDGDANSLREALYFKVPSIASDAVARPEGTVLFKNRDVDDLAFRVRHLLENYESCKEELDKLKLDDNFEKTMESLITGWLVQ